MWLRGLAPLLLAIVSLAAGCAPTVASMGPRVTEPVMGEDYILMPDSEKLPLRIWAPDGAPKAAILALHGFNEYSRSLEGPAEFWAGHGMVTYAYDQRGFGEAPNRGLWPGTETLVADLRVAAGLVKERHPDVPVYLLGESMGGAVVLTALGSADPPRATGAVLVAPAVRGWRVLPWYQRTALNVVAHTIPWATATGRGIKVTPSDNTDMLVELWRDELVIKETRFDAVYGLVTLMDEALDAARRLPVPALVLYGKTEDLVPRSGRQELLESLPPEGDWRLAEYGQGYHMLLRDLNAEVVLQDILAWLGDRDTALPSGEERPDRKLDLFVAEDGN